MRNRIFNLRATRGRLDWNPTEINLFAYQSDDRTHYAAQKLELKQSEEGEGLEPFLSIEQEVAQRLMDDLWDCGLRPSEGSGSAGSLRATQKHLEDMKTIAFHALKIKENT